MNVNKITLGYWSTKGLGSASRQMIIYSGVSLISKIYRLIPKLENNCLTYDGSDWHDKDKIILKKKNSLINLPYLQFSEGGKEIIIAQSITCLSFLGKKFNMFGENSKEELECNQLLQETVDLRNIVTRFAYTHFENDPHNFDLKNKGLYDDKFPTFLSSYAPGVGKNLNVHNFFILRWISIIKFFLKKKLFKFHNDND